MPYYSFIITVSPQNSIYTHIFNKIMFLKYKASQIKTTERNKIPQMIIVAFGAINDQGMCQSIQHIVDTNTTAPHP